MTRYRISFRNLFVLIAVAGVLAFGVRFGYKRQSARQAVVLEQQAAAAEASGDTARAVRFLEQYLSFAPNDHAARARLGLLLATADSPGEWLQAYLLLEEVLRTTPERDDVRRRAVELALALGTELLPDAKRHLDRLIARHPGDGELEALYADCYLLEARYPQADDRLKKATQKKPDLFAVYVRRALLLRQRLNDPEEADRVVAAMLDHGDNRKAFRAHLAAAAYWDECGNQPARANAVSEARKLAPDDLEVLVAAADIFQDRADDLAGRDEAGSKKALGEARDTLRLGIDRHAPAVAAQGEPTNRPADPASNLRRALVGELFRRLAAVEVRAGQPAEAEKAARRGVELLPNAAVLRVALVDACIRLGRWDEAGRELETLRESGYQPAVLAYHSGRIQAANGQWLKAAKTLEGALAGGAGQEFVAAVSLLLGGCYEQTGELDRQYAAYRRAAAVDQRDPAWPQATARLAATLVEMGQDEEAVQLYERLAARGAAGARVPLGRLLLSQALRRPDGQRDWARVERVVQSPLPGADGAVLRAEYAVARHNDLDGARATLEAAIADHPEAIGPWLALVAVEHRAKQPSRARERLDAARAKFRNTAEVRLAEARTLSAAEAPAGLARLAEGAEQLPAARQLLEGLAEVADRNGAVELAARLRERLSVVAPHNLGVWLARLDDAIRRNDAAGAEGMLGKVREIDGADGVTARTARAIHLIARAQAGDRGGLPEAERLLEAVAKQRPSWSRVAVARGLIADLRGDAAAAAASYRDAVDAGDHRPEVVQRLLALYYARGQARDAYELVRRLPDAAAGSALLVAEVSARSGDLKRAIDSANRGVPEDSTDPRSLLVLAHIRRLAGAPPADVERPIRRAIQLAEDRPEGWVALVQHLADTGTRPASEQAVREAEAKVRGPARSLAVAQCHEALGNFEPARAAYEAALAERPAHVPTLRAAASFYLKVGEPDEVTRLCDRILGLQDLSPDDRQFAVRLTGVVLTARLDYQTSRRRLADLGVLESGLPTRLTGSETVGQLRTRAVVLAVQPDAKLRREGIAALEALELRQPLAAEDQFLLARMYVSVGEWPKAEGRLVRLARDSSDNLYYLAYYGFGVLQYEGHVQKARSVLAAMEKVQPDAPRTVELKARILDEEGKPGEAANLLLEYAARHPVRAEFAAALLERLGLGDRAESLYRAMAADPKRPSGGLALAGYLGRQGRCKDALEVIRKLAGKVEPMFVAAAGVEALYNAHRVDPADAREVEGWIAAAGRASPKSDLRPLTAVVRMAEGRYGEAIEQYRASVAGGGVSPLTLNNLGYLLATQENRVAEGLEWVRKAQRAAGPLPQLRDTEALILTRNGQAQRAVELLTEITRESPDPTTYFHLAQAHRAANDPASAAQALRQAKRWKLRPIDVPPPERKDVAEAMAPLP